MRLNIIRIIKHFFHTTRRIIGNLRATVMEGSLGNQKLHFGLGVIVARNSRSETLLLFFGIHLANASILAARQLAREKKSSSERSQGLIKSDRFFPSSGDTSERLIIPCQQESGATPPPKLPFFESKATVEPKNIKYGQLRTISTSPLTEYPYLTQTRLSEIFSYCFN